MGAWGIKTFENDDASDWIYGLEEASDLSLIEDTLKLAESDYLEEPDGCNILAALEVILVLQGKACSGLPEEASAWAAKHVSLDTTSLVSLAITSLERVLSEDSEIKELWEESEDFQNWRSDVLSIKAALEN